MINRKERECGLWKLLIHDYFYFRCLEVDCYVDRAEMVKGGSS